MQKNVPIALMQSVLSLPLGCNGETACDAAHRDVLSARVWAPSYAALMTPAIDINCGALGDGH